ncbi:MAG: GNAT family protein [Boseongicola sp.]|nr:GNAT family protein [Boseongicola sp.]
MSLKDWSPPSIPSRTAIEGRYVVLEPVEREHFAGLMEAFAADADGGMWEYLPHGPFDQAGCLAWIDAARASPDPLHYAVRMEDGRLGGTLSLMRIKPAAGSIETGWLTFSPRLQRTREATEAVYQLMRWSFEAGYRRFEWKCDAANHRSRRAAERFGFSYEGIFRRATVVKGRNRDTAWYACIDSEWPALKEAFEAWLETSNFDASGKQRQRLGDLTAPILACRDPFL